MPKLRFMPLIFVLVLTACAFTSAQVVLPQPTATTVRVLQTTPVPTIDRQIHIVPSPQASATTRPPLFQCGTQTDATSVTYRVEADVAYQHRTVMVRQDVHYTNRTKDAFDQLVLNVRANGYPKVFSLEIGDIAG